MRWMSCVCDANFHVLFCFWFGFSYKEDASGLVRDCFKSSCPRYLVAYMKAVYKLDYTEEPSYEQLKKLFSDHLGKCDPTKTLEWVYTPASSRTSPRKVCICVWE